MRKDFENHSLFRLFLRSVMADREFQHTSFYSSITDPSRRRSAEHRDTCSARRTPAALRRHQNRGAAAQGPRHRKSVYVWMGRSEQADTETGSRSDVPQSSPRGRSRVDRSWLRYTVKKDDCGKFEIHWRYSMHCNGDS